MDTPAAVDDLTLAEKAALTGGQDMWHVPPLPDRGVGRLKVTDGPSGARGARFTGTRSVNFPCGTALAATFDVALVGEIGRALGEEVRRKGAHVLLAPTVNIHRTPLAGRNFECFSEDPYLSAEMAVAYIEGVQSQGVGCCVKHFACNDQEHERMTISVDVDEQALREIYLPPFEAAVRRAGVWAVMSAYNKVRGRWCGENAQLLTDILKGEWGFDGAVISDWFGTHSTADAANAGLDLEMPGPAHWLGPHLAQAVEKGEVDEKVVDDKVDRLLRLMARTGVTAGEEQPERSDDTAADRALVRRAAAAAMVLLRNDGTLPLAAGDGARTVAVIGPAADRFEMQGGGSAQVSPHPTVSPLDAIRAVVEASGGTVAYEPGCAGAERAPLVDPRRFADSALTVEYFADPDFGGAPVHTETAGRSVLRWMGEPAAGVPAGSFSARATTTFTPGASGPWRFRLESVGQSRLLLDGAVAVDNWSPTPGRTFYGLGSAPVEGTLDLDGDHAYELVLEYRLAGGPPLAGVRVGAVADLPDDALERAVAAASGADVAVVVVGSDSEWESEGFDRKTLDLPGRQAELVERVCAANARTVVVVNTGAPVSMDWSESAGAVVQTWFPGQEGAHALADVLFGDVSPSGRLPVTIPRRLEDTPASGSTATYPGEDGVVRYAEGLHVGYRHYATRGIEPAYCFGHGLSYTTFEYGPGAVTPAADGDGVVVSVDVTNTGGRAGREVVQVYVRHPDAGTGRPDRELKGFAVVDVEAGQTSRVDVAFPRSAFTRWSDGAWTVEPGVYEILVGASSADIRCTLQTSV
ncbi:MAG TPA: glycoside hydrolase family 3 C-terminal domain-containing protein [Acidimicrobiales bacterium]|nr:glycoside hydrolase family 3 C-terminal domain-containing protein [Acidimicrobiales bacterium]